MGEFECRRNHYVTGNGRDSCLNCSGCACVLPDRVGYRKSMIRSRTCAVVSAFYPSAVGRGGGGVGCATGCGGVGGRVKGRGGQVIARTRHSDDQFTSGSSGDRGGGDGRTCYSQRVGRSGVEGV